MRPDNPETAPPPPTTLPSRRSDQTNETVPGTRSVESSEHHGAKKSMFGEPQPPQPPQPSTIFVPMRLQTPTATVPAVTPAQQRESCKSSRRKNKHAAPSAEYPADQSAEQYAGSYAGKSAVAPAAKMPVAKTPVAKLPVAEERVAHKRANDGGPVPLSPDALTAFANGDPDAKEWNTCDSKYLRSTIYSIY